MANPTLNEYIKIQSKNMGLDPNAVLAVAMVESASGRPGDRNAQGVPTSFGPFQMHEGGKLPAQFNGKPNDAQVWAWSKQGVDYALAGMSKIAKGSTGPDAVGRIVTNFEQPANIPAEINAAVKNYGKQPTSIIYQQPVYDFTSATAKTDVNSFWKTVSDAVDITFPVTSLGGLVNKSKLNPVVDATKKATEIKSPLDFLKKLLQPDLWLRIGQVVGGAILLGMGLFLLMKQIGLAAPTTPLAALSAAA